MAKTITTVNQEQSPTTTHNHCKKPKLAKNHHTNHHQHSHTTTDPRNPKPSQTHKIQPHHHSRIPLPRFYLDRSHGTLKLDEGGACGVGWEQVLGVVGDCVVGKMTWWKGDWERDRLVMGFGLVVRWRTRLVKLGWSVRWRTGLVGERAWVSGDDWACWWKWRKREFEGDVEKNNWNGGTKEREKKKGNIILMREIIKYTIWFELLSYNA